MHKKKPVKASIATGDGVLDFTVRAGLSFSRQMPTPKYDDALAISIHNCSSRLNGTINKTLGCNKKSGGSTKLRI